MTRRNRPPPEKSADVIDAETRRTQRRVAKTRDKLSKALEDPDMREQMVAAIRAMMQKDR
jgi:hypothetical protein